MNIEEAKLLEYDEDGNAICPVCKCHYRNLEHKCPEWMLLLIKSNQLEK